jgi:hypothetical protein
VGGGLKRAQVQQEGLQAVPPLRELVGALDLLSDVKIGVAAWGLLQNVDIVVEILASYWELLAWACVNEDMLVVASIELELNDSTTNPILFLMSLMASPPPTQTCRLQI